MNGIDYLLLWVVGFSILFSVLRGSNQELVKLLGWVISFLAAMMLASRLEPRLLPYLQSHGHVGLVGTAAFLLVFSSIKLPLTVTHWLVNRLSHPGELSPFSRVLAVGWGVGRGAVILLVAGMVWLSFDPPSTAAIHQSRLAPWCIEGAHRLTARLVPASVLRDKVMAGYGHYRSGSAMKPVTQAVEPGSEGSRNGGAGLADSAGG
ncbi:MAG: CvpA family protein [Magnetococcus sp. DMHC-1]|nr:CvpA family protein [Magnetococcales bacterium]MBF0322892.1 CvpA family protein [Magnetococcales bacterium]